MPLGRGNANGPFLPLNDKNFLLDFCGLPAAVGRGFLRAAAGLMLCFQHTIHSFCCCFALSETLFDFRVCRSPPKLVSAVYHLLSCRLCSCIVLFKRILGEMIICALGLSVSLSAPNHSFLWLIVPALLVSF